MQPRRQSIVGPRPWTWAKPAGVALVALTLTGCAASGDAPSGFISGDASGGWFAAVERAEADAPREAGAAPVGRPESIDPTYDAAAVDGPSDPEAAKYARRAAEIAMEADDAYAAAVHLSRLYEEEPNDPAVAYELARHMRYIGALTEAEQVLTEAIARAPNDPLLRLELAKTHIAAGRPERGLEVLDALKEERPSDPSILQTIGLAHDRAGDHDAAQAAYAQAMRLGSPSAALLSNAGLSHLLSGDLEQAIALLERAVATPGATSQVRQNLALALTLAGRTDEARRVSRAALPPEISASAMESFEGLADAGHAWTRAAE